MLQAQCSVSETFSVDFWDIFSFAFLLLLWPCFLSLRLPGPLVLSPVLGSSPLSLSLGGASESLVTRAWRFWFRGEPRHQDATCPSLNGCFSSCVPHPRKWRTSPSTLKLETLLSHPLPVNHCVLLILPTFHISPSPLPLLVFSPSSFLTWIIKMPSQVTLPATFVVSQ